MHGQALVLMYSMNCGFKGTLTADVFNFCVMLPIQPYVHGFEYISCMSAKALPLTVHSLGLQDQLLDSVEQSGTPFR